MIRYAITDRLPLPGDDAALLRLAAQWAADGIDFVQLRQKEMAAATLMALARRMLATLGPGTKLLINGRADIAIATGAAGVHLTAQPDELTPAQVRQIFSLAGGDEPVISVSCHTVEAARRARDAGAAIILFAPVFEKRVDGNVVAYGAGLESLRRVCEAAAPARVLALGGVTWANAPQCAAAGAAGVAGIRLFSKLERSTNRNDFSHDATGALS